MGGDIEVSWSHFWSEDRGISVSSPGLHMHCVVGIDKKLYYTLSL